MMSYPSRNRMGSFPTWMSCIQRTDSLALGRRRRNAGSEREEMNTSQSISFIPARDR